MNNTQTFLGGAVRDLLLGFQPKDCDFVVVGSTAEQMLADGFAQVGADFPVFLHPETGDEELQAIAVGHDLFEDTAVTAAQLRAEGIPERVVSGILGLTKMPGQSYEEYQAGVFSSRDRMLVKSADLTHNMDLKRLKGVRPKDIERAGRYIEFYYAIQMRLLDPHRGVEGATGVKL